MGFPLRLHVDITWCYHGNGWPLTSWLNLMRVSLGVTISMVIRPRTSLIHLASGHETWKPCKNLPTYCSLQLLKDIFSVGNTIWSVMDKKDILSENFIRVKVIRYRQKDVFFRKFCVGWVAKKLKFFDVSCGGPKGWQLHHFRRGHFHLTGFICMNECVRASGSTTECYVADNSG